MKATRASGSESTDAPLVFKSGAAAHAHACKYMDCTLQEGSNLLAVVTDCREQLGTQDAVRVQDDGNQLAVLCVVSNDGGFLVLATTSGPKGPALRPGQLVVWRAMSHQARLQTTDDERSGWMGLIVGTLQPEYRNGGWVGDEQFLPLVERFFNWEYRPAVIRETPTGGLEGLFVAVDETSWSRVSPVEILESGSELSRNEFLEMYPEAPPLI